MDSDPNLEYILGLTNVNGNRNNSSQGIVIDPISVNA